MSDVLKGKTVLITGGTGSFGRALVDVLRPRAVKEIRIFSRDELKQELMRIELDEPRLKFHIGDVRSRESVDAVMHGVDFVFHAAALKQVPSCDFFPMQAVYTNVNGSHNVVDSAIKHGAMKVICLSTDKAFYPINAMGMTKALMEKVAQAAARTTGDGPTVVSVVRYGNVMYSRGSVIPLFVQQMKDRQPLTITEPRMRRFLLPLSEAVDLVLFAFEHGRQGDILIRKAPACTVADLAAAMRAAFKSTLPVFATSDSTRRARRYRSRQFAQRARAAPARHDAVPPLLLKRPLTVLSLFNDSEDVIGLSAKFAEERKKLKLTFENEEIAHEFAALNLQETQ